MQHLRLLLPILALPAHELAAQGLTRPAERIEFYRPHAGEYPHDALRANAQGLTSVRFEVDETGRVVPQSCKVTVTSGHRSLDTQTCLIIESRYRFVPAMESGMVVRESKASGILWRIPGLSISPNRMLAQRLVHHSGNCWRRAAPEATQTLVNSPMGSAEQAAAATSLLAAVPRCLDNVKNAPSVELAGAAAEDMMSKQFRRVGPPLPSGATPTVPRNGTEELAFCVVRRDPLATRQLIDSAPTSVEEVQELARLAPHLEACVGSGNTPSLTKPSMRALFAIALYRDAAYAASVALQP